MDSSEELKGAGKGNVGFLEGARRGDGWMDGCT